MLATCPLPVDVSGVPASRLPSAVESTAYFVTAEALTNVAKYAQAGHAFVHVSEDHRLHLRWAMTASAVRIRPEPACAGCAIGSMPSTGPSRWSRHRVGVTVRIELPRR